MTRYELHASDAVMPLYAYVNDEGWMDGWIGPGEERRGRRTIG